MDRAFTKTPHETKKWAGLGHKDWEANPGSIEPDWPMGSRLEFYLCCVCVCARARKKKNKERKISGEKGTNEGNVLSTRGINHFAASSIRLSRKEKEAKKKRVRNKSRTINHGEKWTQFLGLRLKMNHCILPDIIVERIAKHA